MSHAPDRGNDEPSVQQLRDAVLEVEQLRELLQRAGSDKADAQEVTESFRQYWNDHGPALRAAAWVAAEELRLQSLAVLYQWREQLEAQLKR